MRNDEPYKPPPGASSLAAPRPVCDVRAVRIALACLLVIAAACDRGADRPPGSYGAVVDLAPDIRALGAEEQSDVDDAVERLAAHGDIAVPILEQAIASEPTPIKLGAIDAIAQIGTPRARAALAALATRPGDPELRATALLRLGEDGDAAARPALEAALADPAPMVSQTAAVACGALCTSPASIERIVALGLEGMPAHELDRLRATLGQLLARTDDVGERTRSIVRARTDAILASGGSVDARTRAALLAADAGRDDVESILLVGVRDAGSVALRVAAMRWVGRSGSAAAVPVLQAALGDRAVAADAALALQTMAGRGIVDAKAVPNPAGLAAGRAAP
jgi:HEAT repeat protein